MDYTIHEILQARILECVAIPFSRGSSKSRDQTRSPTLQADSLSSEPPGHGQYTKTTSWRNRKSEQTYECYGDWINNQNSPNKFDFAAEFYQTLKEMNTNPFGMNKEMNT